MPIVGGSKSGAAKSGRDYNQIPRWRKDQFAGRCAAERAAPAPQLEYQQAFRTGRLFICPRAASRLRRRSPPMCAART
jgi:hypothetical protein